MSTKEQSAAATLRQIGDFDTKGDSVREVFDRVHGADGAYDAAVAMLASAPHPTDAEPKAQQEPVAWRPIETAPKDGRLFLCWVSAVRYAETDEGQPHEQDASQVDFCSWREGPPDLPGHGYFDPCCGQIGDSQGVTHWMPLPTAPDATPPTQAPADPMPHSAAQKRELLAAIGALNRAMGSPCVGGKYPETIESATVMLAAQRLRDAHDDPVRARLLEALKANHQWHLDNDDYDGYPESELCERNLAAIAAAEPAAGQAADDEWNEAGKYQQLRKALQEADTIMGHDDDHTAWRERWQHLWPWGGPNVRAKAE